MIIVFLTSHLSFETIFPTLKPFLQQPVFV